MKVNTYLIVIALTFYNNVCFAQTFSTKQIEQLYVAGASKTILNAPVGFDYIGTSRSEAIVSFASKKFDHSRKGCIEFLQFYTQKKSLHYLMLHRSDYLIFKKRLIELPFKLIDQVNEDGKLQYYYSDGKFVFCLNEISSGGYYDVAIADASAFQ